MNALLPTAFYFRFSFPVRYQADMPAERSRSSGAFQLLALSDDYLLPSVASLDGRTDFAQVRAGWNERGLGVTLTVDGKHRPPQVERDRLELSDALHLWIDTRDARSIHRATRFCHHFYFLPALQWPSQGRARSRQATPVRAGQLRINRAREDAPHCLPSDLVAFASELIEASSVSGGASDQRETPATVARRTKKSNEPGGRARRRRLSAVRSSDPPSLMVRRSSGVTTDDSALGLPRLRGYLLEAFIPARVLTGFDPQENPRLGFYYHVHDAELGDQFLTVGREFPFAEDPSLWSTLELTK